jgi:hypothetical protein
MLNMRIIRNIGRTVLASARASRNRSDARRHPRPKRAVCVAAGRNLARASERFVWRELGLRAGNDLAPASFLDQALRTRLLNQQTDDIPALLSQADHDGIMPGNANEGSNSRPGRRTATAASHDVD